MNLTLGVLGPSPAAMLEFLATLQALTPTSRAEDHIRVLADINPGALTREGSSGAGPALAEMAGALRGAGADILAIASNEAHAWADLIQRASGLPMVDMIQVAAAAAHDTGARRVGVLGARGALRLYREYLAAQGLGMISLAPESQEALVQALQRIEGGERGPTIRAELVRLARELEAQGAEAVIAGAVEAPLVLCDQDIAAQWIDPVALLAERCVAVCLGDEPVPAPLGA